LVDSLDCISSTFIELYMSVAYGSRTVMYHQFETTQEMACYHN